MVSQHYISPVPSAYQVITMSGKGVVKVAATQQACTWDIEANLAQAEAHVRAAAKGEAVGLRYFRINNSPACTFEPSPGAHG